MFYCYFSNKLVVYECITLYLLWFVLDFVKLYLFVNCCDEINNSLFNGSVLIFINAITKL